MTPQRTPPTYADLDAVAYAVRAAAVHEEHARWELPEVAMSAARALGVHLSPPAARALVREEVGRC
jgi:hypothetical protein